MVVEYDPRPEEWRMTKVELVARALAASRTGRVEGWNRCRADALLVLAACGQDDELLLCAGGTQATPPPANDR